MRKTYRFVPSCPRCGSDITGYYIYSISSSNETIIKNAIKKGELVRIRTGFRNSSDPNCYCEECNMEWFGKIEQLKLYPDEVEEERMLRRINQTTIYKSTMEQKEMKKDKKKNKIKNIFKNLIDSIKPY